MFPQQYTFEKIAIPPGKPDTIGFIDVVRGPDGFPAIIAKPVDDCPQIIRPATGERGRLVRSITNDIRNLPDVGKVTITVEYLIWTEQQLYRSWKTGEWALVGINP